MQAWYEGAVDDEGRFYHQQLTPTSKINWLQLDLDVNSNWNVASSHSSFLLLRLRSLHLFTPKSLDFQLVIFSIAVCITWHN